METFHFLMTACIKGAILAAKIVAGVVLGLLTVVGIIFKSAIK